MNKLLNEKFNISNEIIALGDKALNSVSEQFSIIESNSRYNQLKVLSAFQNQRVSEAHFTATTGYGYDDAGRDVIDALYAEIFGSEDALVRHNIINGTHAISLCLFAVLRPGDVLVAATGKPYDTLEEVIGIRGGGIGSLKDFGIQYRQVDMPGGEVDYDGIKNSICKNTKALLIQKSKGYSFRKSLSNSEIGKIVECVKAVNPNIVCIVDNCYGEFVEISEPNQFDADMAAGSLIKNPGGGLVSSGGYITGKSKYVEMASYKLNSVGLGKHVGATLGFNRQILQGLFMAPHTVGESLKTAVFCSAAFDLLGFNTNPKPTECRTDIIQAVEFGHEQGVISFCRGIQKGAPIDSFVTPYPWDMPGYDNQVIMAAGAFVQGASIELSADGPIKPPYIAFMQGGLTFDSAYAGVLSALQTLANDGIIKL